MSENTKVTMQVKANGSIRVSGDVDFIDADGNVIKSENGFSLCRCGLDSGIACLPGPVSVSRGLSRATAFPD